MRRYGFCWDERDHQERARQDAKYGRRDYDSYDRFTSDPCKETYTEEYDRERRRIEDRQEEERQADEREYTARQRQEDELAEQQRGQEEFSGQPSPEEADHTKNEI